MRNLADQHPLRTATWLLGGLGALFLAVWLFPPHHAFEGISQYQSVHLPMETLSIVVSMLVFGVAWNAYSRDRPANIVILACALLAVGLIDFAHMLSFAGMPFWVTPSGPEKAINFWLAARFVFAVALLVVALRPWAPLRRQGSRYALLFAALGTAALVYWVGLFYQDDLPHTFIEGKGLTPLKVGAEHVIVGILAVPAVIFWRQARYGERREAAGLFSAAVVTILSELCFTLYSNVTDIFNLLGHVYKIAAYVLIYRTVFVGSVREPFRRVVEAEASLQHANRALRTISSGNRALVHARDEAELLNDMCRTAVEKGGYLLAWVGYAQPDQHIKPVAMHAVQPGYVEALLSNWAEDALEKSPVGLAVRSGEAQICQDVASDSQASPWRAEALKFGYRASIAMPLRDKGSVFGVMALYAAVPLAFTDEEITLLSEMADDLAFGILGLRTRDERDHALAERQQYVDRLRDGLKSTVQAISATIEMRDPYTAGHQRRVADLAAAIAAEMKLPPEQVEAINLAGIVHDLGKVAIPSEILTKPTRLTELEYTFLKTHPQVGFDILKDIDFSWPVAQMVLQHHERMDGSGYPQGLKGDAILLEARILAVADVIEAISSHRPYRASLGIEPALAEIRDHRGTHYDAAVVDAALRLIGERGYQFKP